MKSSLATLSCFLLFHTIAAFGQPGTLDPNFGKNGIVTTDYSNSNDRGNSVIVQPDGKILVGGNIGSDEAAGVMRYNPDGSLDKSFGGSSGKASATIAGSIYRNYSTVLQSDGKILMVGFAGTLTGTPDFALIRFLDDGRLDQDFGTNGAVTTDFGNSGDFGYSAAVQLDGKILVVGFIADNARYDIALARYETDGTLDQSFGSGGKVTTDFGGVAEAHSVAVQPDGKILVAGFVQTSSHPNMVLARYEADGTLDQSFGSGGKVTTNFGGAAKGYSVLIQSDGKILVAGSGSLSDSSKSGIVLARYHADGSSDQSFGPGSRLVTTFEYAANAYSAIIQPDGKILVAGSVVVDAKPPVTLNALLARYEANGTPDGSFSTGGIVISPDFFISDIGQCLALAPDGRILVAGYAKTSDSDNHDFALACYLSGLNVGVLDFSQKQIAATFVYPNPVQNEATLEYTLTKAEKITVDLYNLTGRLLQPLLSGERSAGSYRETLRFGESLAPGNYMLVLSNGEKKISVKMVKY